MRTVPAAFCFIPGGKYFSNWISGLDAPKGIQPAKLDIFCKNRIYFLNMKTALMV